LIDYRVIEENDLVPFSALHIWKVASDIDHRHKAINESIFA